MSTELTQGVMTPDPALLRAVETLRSVEGHHLPDGGYECPICGRSTASNGITAHMMRSHETCIPAVSLGTSRWRDALEVVYSEHGMSPYRIADYMPGHTSRRVVIAEIERFGLADPETDYGRGRVRHPDDPFEAVVRETWTAAQAYLDDPLSSTFCCADLVGTVDLTKDQVSKALRELKERGLLTPVNKSTPHRWTLTKEARR